MTENFTRGSAMKGIAICYREITRDCSPLRLCRLFTGRVRIVVLIYVNSDTVSIVISDHTPSIIDPITFLEAKASKGIQPGLY